MRELIIFLLVILGVVEGLAQEICNNGIDDNGDGLIDCYDSQCSGVLACDSFFYGQPPNDCQVPPPPFGLSLLWETSFTIDTRSTMFVGDIDNDGIPEVICYKITDIYILDGTDGTIELTINAGDTINIHTDGPVIADTDGDGFGEIYIVTEGGPLLKCFEHDGTLKFTALAPVENGTYTPAIADFDDDGIPEVYVGNKIYNALTGNLITSGVGSKGENFNRKEAFPVAADVLPDAYCADCSGLELVCGNTVYAINISAGTMTAQVNSLPGALNDGFTSVADMDLDGELDVIVVSEGAIYIWDPRSGLQMGNTINIPNTTNGGRANIGDYDNDGIPDIGVGGLNRYLTVDFDTSTFTLSQKWLKTIADASSDATTGSIFDFECDGAVEVVYRDEENLQIWDGVTGNVKATIPCGSATSTEFATVVDVNGDGQANIVCTCTPGSWAADGKVKAFKSSAGFWVPTREVMNQHTYFVVNINDDLSVPQNQQNHALIPKLNTFLSQSPVIWLYLPGYKR